MNSGVVLIQIVLESASESVLKASKKENEWKSPFKEVSIAVWLLFLTAIYLVNFVNI